MRKLMVRFAVVASVAAVVLNLAPVASALYPPDIARTRCINVSRNPLKPGKIEKVNGVAGCGLKPNGERSITRVRFVNKLVKKQKPEKDGSYTLKWRTREDLPKGFQELKVLAGGTTFTRPIRVKGSGQQSASATLETPSMRAPAAAAVGVLLMGAWFMFVPVSRRRRLSLIGRFRQAKRA